MMDYIYKHIDKVVQNTKVADYLRSKGYALPYMGISVEDQIKYGWIKLTEIQP